MFDLDSSLSYGNSMFTNFFNMEKNYTFDVLYPSNTRITTDNTLVTLFRQLLQNNEFRNNFVDAFCIAGGSVFTPERCTSIIDSLTARIGPAMAITGESPYSTANDMKNAFNNNVEALYRMMDDRVEGLEFAIREDRKFEGKPLKDLHIKNNTLVCAIYRKNKIIRPGGNDIIRKGDNVVIVTTNTGLNDIEDIFE